MINIDKQRLVEQLKKDEGFVAKAYFDIKQWSNGYGTKALNKDEVVSKEEATRRMLGKVEEAIISFQTIFKGHETKFQGEEGSVRAEAFVNLIYNMGPGVKGKPKLGGLQSFQNTLGHIFEYDNVDWARVGYNLTMSKWATQVGGRAKRIIREITLGRK